MAIYCSRFDAVDSLNPIRRARRLAYSLTRLIGSFARRHVPWRTARSTAGSIHAGRPRVCFVNDNHAGSSGPSKHTAETSVYPGRCERSSIFQLPWVRRDSNSLDNWNLAIQLCLDSSEPSKDLFGCFYLTPGARRESAQSRTPYIDRQPRVNIVQISGRA